MNYDQYGIDETTSFNSEGLYVHADYPDIKFAKSSFLKSWADQYVKTEIKTILDVGAFDGGDSLRFSSWYPTSMIYAIEASPSNFEILNAKLDNKRANIKSFNFAMTSENKPIKFYQTIINLQAFEMIMGGIYQYNDEHIQKHYLKKLEPIVVPGISFDQFCEDNNINTVDILHIDVEGATFDVISGMTKILPKLIFTEKEGRSDVEIFTNKTTGGNAELIKLLNEKGYEMVIELWNDILFVLK
jgi:2-O-methyltransferase